VSAILFGFFVGLLGRLRADPVFEGLKLYADVAAAKATSGIDLFAVGTNLWASAVEGRAGKFFIRAALDKTHYQLGEPIHLFFYRLPHSQEPTRLPKADGYQIIRPVVVDNQNRPIPLSPVGEWQASYPNALGFGGRFFPTNQVNLSHIDLAELVTLTDSGKYLVSLRILLNFYSGDPEQPESAELPAIPFEVTATRFDRPTNAPSSVLVKMYQQHLNEQAGRSPPLTDEEKRIRAEQEQSAKEQYELARPFFEAEALKAAAANLPASPPRPVASAAQEETDTPPLRPLRWPLLGAGAAVLAVLGWLWRRRGA